MILQLLNVLIGLSLIYVIFSTIASAFFELVESGFKQRGKMLFKGLKQIFEKTSTGNAAAAKGDALKPFYEHPLINGLFDGEYKAKARNLPSYIPPERFARAVLMLAEDTAGAASAANQHFVQLKTLAERLVGQQGLAAGQTYAQALEGALIQHFNDSMDRVSGWFARYARWVLLIVGFLLALGANVDTIRIVRTLSMDPILAERIAGTAAEYVEKRGKDATAGNLLEDDACKELDAAAVGNNDTAKSQIPPVEPNDSASSSTEAKSIPEGSEDSSLPKAADAGSGSASYGSPPTGPAPASAPDKEIATKAPEKTSKPVPEPAKKGAKTEFDQQLCQIKQNRQLAESLGLPLGWSTGDYGRSLGLGPCHWGFWLKVFGLLLTGLALSFGASFWFDLLNHLVTLRASLKPAKTGPEAEESAADEDAAEGKATASRKPT